jgi:hypothetical protein
MPCIIHRKKSFFKEKHVIIQLNRDHDDDDDDDDDSRTLPTCI